MITAYLAGPDVFLPHALANATAKMAICAKYGMRGLAPLNDDIDRIRRLPEDAAWRAIYLKDIEMMEASDIIIANLTPFRGASADAGTLVEVGWFLGRGKKIFGYSNTATPFATRSAAQAATVPDPLAGLAVEGFGLADNLMIQGAVEYGGGLQILRPQDGNNRAFDALDVFEDCARAAAAILALPL